MTQPAITRLTEGQPFPHLALSHLRKHEDDPS
jgi:hypothetical protein